MKKVLILSLCAAALTLGLTNCMATKGLGQDMQILGNKLEEKADESMGRTPPPSGGAYVAPPL